MYCNISFTVLPFENLHVLHRKETEHSNKYEQFAGKGITIINCCVYGLPM